MEDVIEKLYLYVNQLFLNKKIKKQHMTYCKEVKKKKKKKSGFISLQCPFGILLSTNKKIIIM